MSQSKSIYEEVLCSIFKKRNLLKANADGSIWVIKSTIYDNFSSKFQNSRDAFLKHIIVNNPSLLLICDEDPLSEGVHGSWRQSDNFMYIIPDDVNIKELSEFFHIGNWAIIATEHPISYQMLWPDKKIEKIKIMKNHNISLILEAYYDNEPWTLYLNLDNL